MSNIYSINDELTPTPPSNNTPEGNSIQQQLSDIEAQRQLNEQHINDNYNRLIADIEAQGNAIDALHSTAQRTHTYDPNTLKAGRNMSALYDSLQLIGTLAAMSGKNTPPAPQLSSAMQENNNLAYKLQRQQAEADNQYNAAMMQLRKYRDSQREKLATQRGLALRQFNDKLADNNRYAAQQRANAIGDALNAYNDTIQEQRRHKNNLELEDRRAKNRINVKLNNKNDKYIYVDADGYSHKIDKEKQTLLGETAKTIEQHLIKNNRADYVLFYEDLKKNNYNAYAQLLVSQAAEGKLGKNAQTTASNFLNNHTLEYIPLTSAVTDDNPSQHIAGNTDETNVWDLASINDEDLDW
ncbi:MAG: hypothetical protein IJE18_07125 [Bacteroidaceae bacterium]|nr:hypothetical protein [Bacteroidaceae bacterium]